jgi:integrase/recombinase XerD
MMAVDHSLDDLPLFSKTPGRREASARGSDGTGPLRPSTSLTAALRAWGESLEGHGASLHTVKAFTGDLRLMARFIGAGQAINGVGTHDIKNFLEWMLSRRGVPCSPKTYSRRVTSIKAFFRWLVDSGALAASPADSVPQHTVLSPLPEILTPEEGDAVVKTADALRHGDRPDARPFALLSLLLDTGIKKSECLAIYLNHIDLKSSDGPVLFVRYGEASKRYRERKLSLSGEWISAYQEYLGQYQPRSRLFPYSPRRLEYILEDLGEAAGLTKHLSFNMCRWTCALNDYRSGMDKDRIRSKLGLSKIQWREIGAKLDRLAATEDTAIEA